jgi:ABC-type transport system substrate-binding protein
VHVNEEYELLPGAAEKWSLSPNGLTWTFTIRQGMVWSDGKPLTAGDFEYAFQRMADPRTGYDLGFLWVDVKNFADAAAGQLPPAAVGVKALDDRTLAITTVAPAPYFPQSLIANTPSRRDLVEKYGEGWSTRPETQAASGPYKLQAWEKGKQVVLVANPDYHGPAKGYYEKIVFLVGPFTAQLPAYERDEIDVLGSGYEFAATAGDTARIKADPVLSKQLHTYTDFATWYLYLDSLTPSSPFTSLKVRQAFSHAIDREALVKSALGGGGVPAYTMLPPGFSAAQPEKLKPIQNFDPALARQRIAEAGFPRGSGFPKQTLFLRDPSVPVKAAAEALQAMVKEHLGITFDIQPLDWNGYMDRLGKVQVQFSLLSYQYDFVDPADMLSIWMYGLGRRHLWRNAEFDSLVTQANTTIGDDAERTALYQRAEEVLVRDVGGVFLWHPMVTQLWKPWIKGNPVQPNKFGVTAWRGFQGERGAGFQHLRREESILDAEQQRDRLCQRPLRACRLAQIQQDHAQYAPGIHRPAQVPYTGEVGQGLFLQRPGPRRIVVQGRRPPLLVQHPRHTLLIPGLAVDVQRFVQQRNGRGVVPVPEGEATCSAGHTSGFVYLAA